MVINDNVYIPIDLILFTVFLITVPAVVVLLIAHGYRATLPPQALGAKAPTRHALLQTHAVTHLRLIPPPSGAPSTDREIPAAP